MAEPLTTTEAKSHLRVTHSSEDSYIDSLVMAARLDIESDSWRSIVRGSRSLTLDAFPAGSAPIYLPRPPLVSVSSILYIDSNGDEQELAGFRVDATHEPGLIVPAYGENWPSTQPGPLAVTIEYIAGYADGSVPENVRHCIRLKLAELYEGRTPAVQEKRTALDRMLSMIRFRDARIAPFMRGEIADGVGL